MMLVVMNAMQCKSVLVFLPRDQSRCTMNHQLNLEVLMFVERTSVSYSAVTLTLPFYMYNAYIA